MKTINLKNNLIKSAIAVVVILSCVSYSYAAVPHLISYQGRLIDKSNNPLEGSHNITIRIYDAETTGTLLWEEKHSGVLIENGIFSVTLGSINSLTLVFDAQYFLSCKVDDDPEMAPRQKIASAGYVYRSEFSNKDLPKGAIIMWSGTTVSIPSGWALCDGSNGTPNLRDKFIAGARSDSGGIAKTNVSGTLAQTGGVADVAFTADNMPAHRHANASHTHTGPAHTHKGPLHQHIQTAHSHAIGSQGSGSTPGFWASWLNNIAKYTKEGGGNLFTESAGAGTTSSSGNGETSSTAIYTSYEGSGASMTNLPPYYALAFIMKL